MTLNLRDDSDENDDEGILNVFTATFDPIDGGLETVDDEEDLVDSKFEKMDDQDDIHTANEKLYKAFKKHEKLYNLATKKLSNVELDWEKLSTKFDEANQTIGALQFEKAKKLEAKLFQVRAQLERTSSAKLDEMISFQKSENNDVKTVLTSKNINKGKSILGTPPKLDKKETKNPRAKKSNNQKFKQKKQHLCHHCGAIGHTRPNFYKWLTTQQCNSMISSGNQNQFPSSFAHLGDLLKALMFLSNLNSFNSSSSSSDQGFAKWKGSFKVWMEKGSK